MTKYMYFNDLEVWEVDTRWANDERQTLAVMELEISQIAIAGKDGNLPNIKMAARQICGENWKRGNKLEGIQFRSENDEFECVASFPDGTGSDRVYLYIADNGVING